MILSTTTGIRYVEHENLNSYRNYPFSETAGLNDSDGAAIAADVFVDAILYPVVSEAIPLRLSLLDCAERYAEVTDGTVTIAGTVDGDCIELYDGLGRHAGSLMLGPGWDREKASGRKRVFEDLRFSAAACCPVVHDGVTSLSDEDGTWRTRRRDLVLEGDGSIVPVIEETQFGPELRFDAQFSREGSGKRLVRQVLFAVAGQTIFAISDEADDSAVNLYTSPLDREDVCWQAHKEDAVAVVADACSDSAEEGCPKVFIGVRSQEAKVCPSDVGNVEIRAEDGVDYKNPVKVTPVEGETVYPRPQVETGMTQDEIFSEAQKMLQRPVTSGNGIRISMPGLGALNGQ